MEIAVHTCPPIASGCITWYMFCTRFQAILAIRRRANWNDGTTPIRLIQHFYINQSSKRKTQKEDVVGNTPFTQDRWFRHVGLPGSFNLFLLPISSCQIVKFFVTLDTELLWGLLRTSKMAYCGEFYLSSVLSFPYLGRRFVSVAYCHLRKVEQIEVQIQEEIQPPPVI